jgi:hypothetical protein
MFVKGRTDLSLHIFPVSSIFVYVISCIHVYALTYNTHERAVLHFLWNFLGPGMRITC